MGVGNLLAVVACQKPSRDGTRMSGSHLMVQNLRRGKCATITAPRRR